MSRKKGRKSLGEIGLDLFQASVDYSDRAVRTLSADHGLSPISLAVLSAARRDVAYELSASAFMVTESAMQEAIFELSNRGLIEPSISEAINIDSYLLTKNGERLLSAVLIGQRKLFKKIRKETKFRRRDFARAISLLEWLKEAQREFLLEEDVN